MEGGARAWRLRRRRKQREVVPEGRGRRDWDGAEGIADGFGFVGQSVTAKQRYYLPGWGARIRTALTSVVGIV